MIVKKNVMISIIIFVSFFLVTCDPGGNLFLTNGYPYEVKISSIYEYQGGIIERDDKFKEGEVFAPAAMSHIEYNNLISIRVEDLEGNILAEYSPDYLLTIRSIYLDKKNRKNPESWIFTEKGLFIGTSIQA
jgi:hypothetical protein